MQKHLKCDIDEDYCMVDEVTELPKSKQGFDEEGSLEKI